MDLTTSYLGLSLKHPIVAAAPPLSATVDDICRLAEAGAASAMMLASELLEHDLGRIGEIVRGLTVLMTERESESVSQIRGSMSQLCVAEPAAFERANYVKVLQSGRPDLAGLRA